MIDYQKQMQALRSRLESLDRRIATLQSISCGAHGPPGREFSDTLRQTQRQREALRERLVALEEADAESWTRHDLMDGVFGILDDLGHSLDRLTHTPVHH